MRKYEKKQKFNIGSAISANAGAREPLFTQSEIDSLKRVSEIALGVIAVAGIATIALVAPNLLMAIDKLFLRQGRRLSKREKEIKTAQAFYYLKKTGLIKLKPDQSGIKILLSKLGKKKLQKININLCRVSKQGGKWDKKWWVVAADIPTEDYRKAADLFRKKIKQMGFYPLQRTLWVYPFNPAKEIEFIADYFGIARFVTVMEVSRMDTQDEGDLLSYFKNLEIL